MTGETPSLRVERSLRPMRAKPEYRSEKKLVMSFSIMKTILQSEETLKPFNKIFPFGDGETRSENYFQF